MNGIALYAVGFLAEIVAAFWQASIFTILWGWFAVPIFGLPLLSIWQSLGIMVTVAIITNQHIPRDEKHFIEMVIYQFLSPAILLAFGAIAK